MEILNHYSFVQIWANMYYHAVLGSKRGLPNCRMDRNVKSVEPASCVAARKTWGKRQRALHILIVAERSTCSHIVIVKRMPHCLFPSEISKT